MKIIVADTQPIFALGLSRAMRLGALDPDFHFAEVFTAYDLDSLQSLLVSRDWNYAFVGSGVTCDCDRKMLHELATQTRVVMMIERGENSEPYKRAKVSAILYRDVSFSRFRQLLNRMQKGENNLSMDARPNRNHLEEARAVAALLSPREKRVSVLVRMGMCNKQIANKLKIGEQIVKNYLRSVYNKLGISTRLELALLVAGNPILESALANPNPLPEPDADAVDCR